MIVSISGSQSFLNHAIGTRRDPRIDRRLIAAMCMLLFVALLFEAAAPANGAQPERITVFERADFVLSEGSRPPDDNVVWQPVSLPHQWRHTHPGITGQGWYRIKFDLAQAPRNMHAVLISNERSQECSFFVNGKNFGGARDLIAGARIGPGFGSPLYLSFPPALLQAGENVIHVRMRTASHPINIQGLGPVTFGDARPVRRATAAHWELGFYAERSFGAMAFAAGLITLFVWFARRSDHVMLWFSITCLSWALANVLRSWLRWTDIPSLLPVLSAYVAYGLVVPAVILCLRTVGLKWRRLEVALWAFLIIEVTFPLWSDVTNVLIHIGWDIANSALLLTGIAIMLYAAPRPLRWAYKMEVAALSLMAVLMSFEVARYSGWVDIESIQLRQYHVPVMLLAIGAAIFERHVLAVWRIEQTNIELERRVGEKTREIETYHAEREEVLRQQALTAERQRIISDMHDGLGASLVGLLRYVQSRPAELQGVEQRVKEALQEMRIAIDALEPSQGDLAGVLGNLRYRLEPLMKAADVHLVWEVAEMPRVEALEPSAVFAIQRAVLEAIFNALKHSGAREIRLAAQPKDDGIEIRIDDDGRGFDLDRPASGLGLGTMRARAHGLGGRLDIASRQGGGTTVIFNIPYRLASKPVGPESGRVTSAAADLPPAFAPGVT